MSSNPPATLGAQIDYIIGTSSPVEWFQALAFDTTAVEYADWHSLVMPAHYGGGGLTCSLRYTAGATAGTLQWAMALRRIPAGTDIDTTVMTYDFNTVNIATLPNAIGKTGQDPITFTNGADMDSVVAGDSFSVRVRRDTGSDTLATDALLREIYVTET